MYSGRLCNTITLKSFIGLPSVVSEILWGSLDPSLAPYTVKKPGPNRVKSSITENGLDCKLTQTSSNLLNNKAVATAATFCLHWQFDIFRTVMCQKLGVVGCLASYLKCLQHVAESSIRRLFRNIVSANLLQNIPLATCATFYFYDRCNIEKKCCVASASANVASVAAA